MNTTRRFTEDVRVVTDEVRAEFARRTGWRRHFCRRATLEEALSQLMARLSEAIGIVIPGEFFEEDEVGLRGYGDAQALAREIVRWCSDHDHLCGITYYEVRGITLVGGVPCQRPRS
ncbi:hypothetical protein HY478_01895 [Candidatus Uhrbacteria bacterium]|nr:hypothetical protein [Candidatus Uhrbacteria bacterium]